MQVRFTALLPHAAFVSSQGPFWAFVFHVVPSFHAFIHVLCSQVSNETTVHVRRPGNPKKWRAKVLCEGKIADLALVTVEDDLFWTDELLDLEFVDVPELQVQLWHTLLLFLTYVSLSAVAIRVIHAQLQKQ